MQQKAGRTHSPGWAPSAQSLIVITIIIGVLQISRRTQWTKHISTVSAAQGCPQHMRLIYLGSFQYSDIPAWAWADQHGSVPRLRRPAIPGDTGTGTICPSVLLRYNLEHQCQRCGPLWVSRVPKSPEGSQNHPRVPKLPGCLLPAACCLRGHSWGSEEPSRGSPWPQPLLAPCWSQGQPSRPWLSALAAAGH